MIRSLIKWLIWGCLWLSQIMVFGQNSASNAPVSPSNNVYLTLGEAHGLVSVNYERAVELRPWLRVMPSLGAGVGQELEQWPSSTETQDLRLHLPFRMLLVVGNKHNLELGMGLTSEITPTNIFSRAYPIIGYRYQGGGQFPAIFRFFVDWPGQFESGTLLPLIPVGLSIGTSF